MSATPPVAAARTNDASLSLRRRRRLRRLAPFTQRRWLFAAWAVQAVFEAHRAPLGMERAARSFWRRARPKAGAWLGTAGLAALCALPARGSAQSAETGDTLTAQVSATEEFDDNLFRLPDGVAATAAANQTSRSDLISIQSVGLKLDKSYSLQRFTIDASLVNYDYRTYSYLNFLGKNANATWRWEITPELTGNVILSQSQSINNFADYTGISARNINTTDNTRLDADYRITGGWHAAAAVYELRQNNDLPVFELEDVRINSFEASGRYESSAGNSIALYARTADGTYLNQPIDPIAQVDDAFHEHEEGVRIGYLVDGKTSLYLQLGELSRTHAHFSSRNFSGPVAQIAYSLDVTGKITFFANFTRTLVSYQQLTSSYLVDNVFSIGPDWALTEKTSVSLRYQEVQYQFHDSLINQGPLRDDLFHRVTLNGTWRPLRNLSVMGSLTHQNRQSNLPGFQFVDNVSSLQATYAF